MELHLLVGLGNPGRQYANTRHNVGFHCVDLLARRHHLSFGARRSEALVAQGEVEGRSVVLAKPQTYMNLSGRAVRGLLSSLKLDAERLLVIHDDLDLPLGRIRLRERGSAGGHHGVQSIIDAIGTNEFRRVRVGIGRPDDDDAIDYVLRPLSTDEGIDLARMAAVAADAVEAILAEGTAAAMNRFNRA